MNGGMDGSKTIWRELVNSWMYRDECFLSGMVLSWDRLVVVVVQSVLLGEQPEQGVSLYVCVLSKPALSPELQVDKSEQRQMAGKTALNDYCLN